MKSVYNLRTFAYVVTCYGNHAVVYAHPSVRAHGKKQLRNS